MCPSALTISLLSRRDNRCHRLRTRGDPPAQRRRVGVRPRRVSARRPSRRCCRTPMPTGTLGRLHGNSDDVPAVGIHRDRSHLPFPSSHAPRGKRRAVASRSPRLRARQQHRPTGRSARRSGSGTHSLIHHHLSGLTVEDPMVGCRFLPHVSGAFGRALRCDIPGFDVEDDPSESWHCPSETGQRQKSFEAVNGKDPVCGTYGSVESSRAIATSSGPTSRRWTEPCAGALLGHSGIVIRTILGPVLRPPACQ